MQFFSPENEEYNEIIHIVPIYNHISFEYIYAQYTVAKASAFRTILNILSHVLWISLLTDWENVTFIAMKWYVCLLESTTHKPFLCNIRQA